MNDFVAATAKAKNSAATKTMYCITGGGENGVNGARWRANAAPHGPTCNIFSDGWNQHVNGAPDETVLIPNWGLSDADFPVTGGDRAESQELYWAWVYVPTPAILQDNNGNFGEFVKAMVGGCGQSPQGVAQAGPTTRGYPDNGLGEFYQMDAGLYLLAFQLSDFSFFGGINLRWSTDGGASFVPVPAKNTFSAQPTIECIEVCIDADTLEMTDVVTGEQVKFDPEFCSWCPIQCPKIEGEPLPDVEYSIISGCDDIDGDPANFVPITQEIVLTNGEQVSTFYTDYGIEGQQAEYTVQGTFVDCATGTPIEDPPVILECDDWEIVTAFDMIGPKGVNVERWNANAATGFPDSTVPSAVFTGAVDYSGMPAHPNAPDGPIVVEGDLLVLDNTNDQSQMRGWTYLYTTEPIRVRELRNRAEAVDYYLGECCGEPQLVATGEYVNNVASGASFDVSLPAGVHFIGFEVFDFSAYSAVDYQYSTDNGLTWARVPAAWLFTAKPRLGKCQFKACPETGLIADMQTGVLNNTALLCEPVLCSPTASPDLLCAPQDYYRIADGATNGVNIKYWGDSAAANAPTSEIFTGFFTHVNGPSDGPAAGDDTVGVHPDWVFNTTNAPADTGAAEQGTDQMLAWSYVYFPEAVDLREINSNTGEYMSFWTGECCGSPEKQLENSEPTLVPRGLFGEQNDTQTLPAGLHWIGFQMSDLSATGGIQLQQRVAGGNWGNIPTANIFTEKPPVEKIKGWRCADGTNWNADRSELIDLTDPLTSCEPILCVASCCGGGDSEGGAELPQAIGRA